MKKIIIILTGLISSFCVFSQSTISYTYDNQGRLTSETYESEYRILLSYDKEGNFISKSIDNYSGINQKKNPWSVRFHLYPNPAGEKIFIETDKVQAISEIGIYEITGRKLKDVDQSGNLIEIPVNDLVSGIYLVIIKSDGRSEILKFLKR